MSVIIKNVAVARVAVIEKKSYIDTTLFQIIPSNNDMGEYPIEEKFGYNLEKQSLSGNQGRIAQFGSDKMLYFGEGLYDGRMYYTYPEEFFLSEMKLNLTFAIKKESSIANTVTAPIFRLTTTGGGTVPLICNVRSWATNATSTILHITMRGGISVTVPISFDTIYNLTIIKKARTVIVNINGVLFGRYSSTEDTFRMRTIDIRTASFNNAGSPYIGDIVLSGK